MASFDFEQIEGRIQRLIDSYEGTRGENRELRQRQEDNERMLGEMRRRLSNVLDRIEKLEQE